MNGEQRFWIGIAWAVVALVLGILWINHLNEQQFIKGGYVRGTLPGTSMTQWIKP